MLDNVRGKTQYLLEQFDQLGLAKQCNVMRTNLVVLITDKNFLSERLTSQLMPNALGIPYTINPADPEQITVLKKLVNILYNVEQLLTEIEGLSLKDDRSLVEFLATSSPVLFKNINSAVNQAYEALQLINYGDQTLKAILSPQFTKLKPGLDSILKRLNQFTPNTLEGSEAKTWGGFLGDTVNILPTKNTTEEGPDCGVVGALLESIPNFFNKLQTIIETESFTVAHKTETTSVVEQELLKKQVQGIVADMNLLASEDNLGVITLQYTKLLQSLGKYTLELINEGAPLTKAAYLKSVEKLNVVKHQFLPTLLAEVESLEESLELKSGLLTQPVMEAMETYYSKLASILGTTHFVTTVFDKIEVHSNSVYGKAARIHFLNSNRKISAGGEIKSAEHLDTLVDSGFKETYQKLYTAKLNEASSRLDGLHQCNRAAMAFFAKVTQLNTYTNKGNLTNVSPQERQELAHLYSQIQIYLAQIDPQLDVEIVNSLNLTSEEQQQVRAPADSARQSLMQTLWGGLSIAGSAMKNVVVSNRFNQIVKIEKQVFNAIQKNIASENLRLAVIRDSESFSKLVGPTLPRENKAHLDSNQESNHNTLQAESKSTAFTQLKALPNKKDTVLTRLKQMNLSSKTHNYLYNDLIPFLEKNLSIEVLKSLNLSDRPFPYRSMRHDPGQVQLYKDLLNAFYHLEKGLSQFERQGGHDYIHGTVERALYLAKFGISLGPALDKVSDALKSLGKNPQLANLLKRGLTLLNPLKQLPGVNFAVNNDTELNASESKEYGSQQFKSIHQFSVEVLNLMNTRDFSKIIESYQTLKVTLINELKSFKTDPSYTEVNEVMIAKVNDVLANLDEQIVQEKEYFLSEVNNLNSPSMISFNDATNLQENILILSDKILNESYKILIFSDHKLQSISQEKKRKYREISKKLPQNKEDLKEKLTLSSQLHEIVTGIDR